MRKLHYLCAANPVKRLICLRAGQPGIGPLVFTDLSGIGGARRLRAWTWQLRSRASKLQSRAGNRMTRPVESTDGGGSVDNGQVFAAGSHAHKAGYAGTGTYGVVVLALWTDMKRWRNNMGDPSTVHSNAKGGLVATHHCHLVGMFWP